MPGVNTSAFFELIKAGLWEKEARLSQYGKIDYEEIMRLAEEQSVDGLITAGLEHVVDVKVPQEVLLQFIGNTLQIEQQNKDMNVFVAKLIEKLQKADINAVLVKGQGIAQSYERPLWRNSGDIDLLLDEKNYEKAKSFINPMADAVEKESKGIKHIVYTVEGWIIELHGTLHCGLSKKMDNLIDSIQHDTFENKYRIWENGSTRVKLPEVNNDIIFVFTHFLKHFFKEGLGLRQICDWCRLMWTYRETLNHGLLENRIREVGLMSEWKAFAAYAVDYLGMSAEVMPLYDKSAKWSKKARRINRFVLVVGNMGHNRENNSNRKESFVMRKMFSLFRRIGDMCNHAMIFPLNSVRFFPYIFMKGVKLAAQGIG